MSTTPLEARLGYFGAFMRAWGTAADTIIAQVEATCEAYRAGIITGATEVERVSSLLGIPPPVQV